MLNILKTTVAVVFLSTSAAYANPCDMIGRLVELMGQSRDAGVSLDDLNVQLVDISNRNNFSFDITMSMLIYAENVYNYPDYSPQTLADIAINSCRETFSK